MSNKNRTPYIICTGTNGRCVVFGWVDEPPVVGQPITLHDARMVLYWSAECGGLFGLAAGGPKTDTRLTVTVEQTACTVVQALAVSEVVAEGLSSWA